MSKQIIADLYNNFDKVNQIVKALLQEKNQIEISNLEGSSLSFVISSIYKIVQGPLLVILNDKEEAAYFYDDLNNLGFAKAKHREF